MNKVKLGEVVFRIKNPVDKDDTDLKYYVGGEHFDSGALRITKRGLIKGSTIGPAFNTKFEKGDVLLMSRNPYLRKAGAVDFDGICSDVSYIIRTKDKNLLLQEFIPIIFQSDLFWDFAEKNKKGSTNFFLNWSDFERFEFALPDVLTQQKLCKAIWSMNSTILSYETLVNNSNQLLQSIFVNTFGDLLTNPKYPTIKLEDICMTKSGGTPTTKNPEFYKGTIPWITTVQLGSNFIDKSNAKAYITEEAINNSSTHLIPKNSILFGTRVGVGKSSINLDEMCTNQDINAIYGINTSEWNLLFIKKVLDSYQSYFDSIKKGATIMGITTKDLKNILVPKVNKQMQDSFASYAEMIEESTTKLEEEKKYLKALQQNILNQYLKK